MWKHWTCDKKFTTIGRSGHFCYTDNNNNFVVEGGLTNNNDFEYDVENDSLPENSRLSPRVANRAFVPSCRAVSFVPFRSVPRSLGTNCYE